MKNLYLLDASNIVDSGMILNPDPNPYDPDDLAQLDNFNNWTETYTIPTGYEELPAITVQFIKSKWSGILPWDGIEDSTKWIEGATQSEIDLEYNTDYLSKIDSLVENWRAQFATSQALLQGIYKDKYTEALDIDTRNTAGESSTAIDAVYHPLVDGERKATGEGKVALAQKIIGIADSWKAVGGISEGVRIDLKSQVVDAATQAEKLTIVNSTNSELDASYNAVIAIIAADPTKSMTVAYQEWLAA